MTHINIIRQKCINDLKLTTFGRMKYSDTSIVGSR